MIGTDILSTGTFIAIFMMSIVLHEYAHGWMAAKCGDFTAAAAGRLTLNPLKHIDPFMSVILPLLLYFSSGGLFIFGAAKPVPINPYRFRNLIKGYRLVSIAGVATNVVIAISLSLLLRVLLATRLYSAESVGTLVLMRGIYFNLLLAIFNMVPIPPLDGSRMLQTFLPKELSDVFDRIGMFGFFILLGLLMVGGFWAWIHRIILFLMSILVGG